MAANAMRGPTDYSNWLVKDQIIVGAYPGSLSDTSHEAFLTAILTAGISTFVCLQRELLPNASDEDWREGRVLRPYHRDLVKIAKRIRRHRAGHTDQKSIRFVYFPVTDQAVVRDADAILLIKELMGEVVKGRKLYIHCHGGHGRAGTVAAILLGILFNFTPLQALTAVQVFHDERVNHQSARSPQVQSQVEQVYRVINSIQSSKDVIGLNMYQGLDPRINIWHQLMKKMEEERWDDVSADQLSDMSLQDSISSSSVSSSPLSHLSNTIGNDVAKESALTRSRLAQLAAARADAVAESVIDDNESEFTHYSIGSTLWSDTSYETMTTEDSQATGASGMTQTSGSTASDHRHLRNRTSSLASASESTAYRHLPLSQQQQQQQQHLHYHRQQDSQPKLLKPQRNQKNHYHQKQQQQRLQQQPKEQEQQQHEQEQDPQRLLDLEQQQNQQYPKAQSTNTRSESDSTTQYESKTTPGNNFKSFPYHRTSPSVSVDAVSARPIPTTASEAHTLRTKQQPTSTNSGVGGLSYRITASSTSQVTTTIASSSNSDFNDSPLNEVSVTPTNNHFYEESYEQRYNNFPKQTPVGTISHDTLYNSSQSCSQAVPSRKTSMSRASHVSVRMTNSVANEISSPEKSNIRDSSRSDRRLVISSRIPTIVTPPTSQNPSSPTVSNLSCNQATGTFAPSPNLSNTMDTTISKDSVARPLSGSLRRSLGPSYLARTSVAPNFQLVGARPSITPNSLNSVNQSISSLSISNPQPRIPQSSAHQSVSKNS